MENGPRKDCHCPFTQGTQRNLGQLCHCSFLQKSCFSGGGPRQALPLAKCLGGQSLFSGLREALCLRRQGRAAQGPVHYFPVFLVPLLLGPVRGDHALSKAESPPPSAPMAGTQSSDSLRGGGHGFSCLLNMGGLVGQERKLQTGTGRSGTGLLQFMRQWEVGPWRVRGPLCQLHVGWPWRTASPLSSLGGTGGKPNTLCDGAGASFLV